MSAEGFREETGRYPDSPAVGKDGYVVTCYTFMFTKHTYDSEKRAWVGWD